MRKLLFLVPLFAVAGTAHAGDKIITASCSAGSCTGTSFTALTEADGALLSDMTSYRVTVCAASGQTLSGAGTIQIGYLAPWAVYTFGGAPWSVNQALAINVTASGIQCETFPDQQVGPVRGRMYARAVSVAVSGGNSLSIFIEGSR